MLPLRKAYLQMHFAIFLWGFTGVLGRMIDMQELVLVWYRIVFSILSIGIYIWWKKESVRISLPDLKKIGFIGCIIALHWVAFYGAIKYSNISVTLSCLASSAIFTALFEPLISKNKKISMSEIVFGIVGFAGIYLIFAFQQLYFTGIVLALVAAFLGAVFTILNKDVVERHSAPVVMFYEMSSGLLLLTLLAPLYFIAFPALKTIPDMNDLVGLIVLSVFCTTLAFTLSLEALKKLSPFTMNLSLNLEPVYGILLAFFFYHENDYLDFGFYAGAFLIFISVILHSVWKYIPFKSMDKKDVMLEQSN